MFFQQQNQSASMISWINFFRRSLMLFIAMLGALFLKSGFSYDSTTTLLKATLLFSILSGAAYTLIFTTRIQLFVERISFFNAILNAGLLCLVAKIIPSFQINHFLTAFWAGLIINFLSWIMSVATVFAPVAMKQETPKDSSGLKQARAKVIGTRTLDEDQD